MYVLGIETSCDETSVSVVKDAKRILSNAVTSSLIFHKRHGGIIPEAAFRMQLETIAQVAECAMKEAGIKLKDIGLVSVTSGPGLSGSLLVGISFAKSLALSLGIPLLGVNHLYSHIYANFFNNPDIGLPCVALVVSGGHTSLFYLKDFDKIKILGATHDDACGEAFDKIAKMLGLGYPGGPVIERLARSGNPKKIKFNCSNTKEPLDFSFSGIKTAVLYETRDHQPRTMSQKADICASFQEAVINALVAKSMLACRLNKVSRLLVAGGVASNNALREKFSGQAKQNGLEVYFPKRQLCLDNAAMVAGFGYRLFKKGIRSDLYLSAQLN